MTSVRKKKSDILETVNRGHEAFLQKLGQLKPSDSSFSYWLTSAALNLCVNLKDAELQGKLEHASDLVIEVKKGFEQMKDLLVDLPEEERDNIAYCQTRLTQILEDEDENKMESENKGRIAASLNKEGEEVVQENIATKDLEDPQHVSTAFAQLTIDSKTDDLPEKYKSDPVSVQVINTKVAQEKNEWIRGLAILDKELFVVTEGSAEIEVYDSIKFIFSRQWNQKELANPKDIVSCNRNKCLYIFDCKDQCKSNEIFRIDPNGKLIKKWSTGENWGESLSVTGESNILFALYTKNQLHEYSPCGKALREIDLPSDIRNPLHAIKLTNGDFMVSHGFHRGDRHRVCIVDANKKLLMSFGRESGKTIRQLDCPSHLAVDGNGFVMVTDRRNARVLLLDSDLKLKREILSKEILLKQKHKFRWPWRILLDESNDRLFVVENWGSGRISIFSFCH